MALELGVFYRREKHGYVAVNVRMPTHIIEEFAISKSTPDALEIARAKGDLAFDNVISGHGDSWIVTKEMLHCGQCGRATK